MILRFFAMRRSAKDYKGPVDSFLNKVRTGRLLVLPDCAQVHIPAGYMTACAGSFSCLADRAGGASLARLAAVDSQGVSFL